ncbi:MAG: carbamoyltransferase HypF [Planctomycetes bacterium]|nr:carbamoyltransferase HypF [Planctomycetota bacterium]
MKDSPYKRERITLSGQVQGVGFRPFVYRLARDIGLTGWVINDSSGATIEVQGRASQIDLFTCRLMNELPPLASIQKYQRTQLPLCGDEKDFEIRPSQGGEIVDAQVTPDIATCSDCLRELFDPDDPRYHYPFINCTNCGPRYTIIERIPYDRVNTTMSDFPMCKLCASQYNDPADRRFHAQPVACAECGPKCWLIDNRGKQIFCDDPIATAADLIMNGRIVAIKGLGGFHLACRADDEHVVNRLRRRKNRQAKPFALMVANLEKAKEICHVPAEAEKLLTSPQCPICLLERRDDAPIARNVAEGLSTLGIMLPYTPIHHLLFAARDLPALIMTSGNVSEEPLIKDNDDAVAHLGRIADAILVHNRRIQRSIDDSVVQVRTDGSIMIFRRARGYAPRPMRLTFSKDKQSSFISTTHTHKESENLEAKTILAVGAELKNTICILRNDQAIISEHIGDLKDGRAYRHFIRVINDLENLFDLSPDIVAADMHPQYLSTVYALDRSAGKLAGRKPLPIIRIQHHHAHAAACMAEHGFDGEAVALICDGTGYGSDGAVWGCEVMKVSLVDFVRLGYLRYFLLPGGDAASIETARPALALLRDALGKEFANTLIVKNLNLDERKLHAIIEQMDKGLNCPKSSSLGRLFDAIAALCGLASENRYEGEAPMLLEAAIEKGIDDEYPFAISQDEPFQIDVRAMIRQIVEDIIHKVDVGIIAARFHNTAASFLYASAMRAVENTSLKTVVLSGGCFANQYLTLRLVNSLQSQGLEVLTHRQIPCNDGGISLGQAVIADSRVKQKVEIAKWSKQNVPGDTC